MARTRLVPRRMPNANRQQRADIDFQAQRVAATRNAAAAKEQRRRGRVSDVKIKFKHCQKNESSKSSKTRC